MANHIHTKWCVFSFIVVIYVWLLFVITSSFVERKEFHFNWTILYRSNRFTPFDCLTCFLFFFFFQRDSKRGHRTFTLTTMWPLISQLQILSMFSSKLADIMPSPTPNKNRRCAFCLCIQLVKLTFEKKGKKPDLIIRKRVCHIVVGRRARAS